MEKHLPIVAIVGRPNVGKSSLFNRLSKEREAIVAREAGTTRDPVHRLVSIGKKSFWLVDTAGLYGDDIQEDQEIGSAAAAHVLETIEAADVVLAVFDATSVITPHDRQIIKHIYRRDKPCLGVINKTDKTAARIPDEYSKLGKIPLIGTSTTTGYGLMELEDSLGKLLPASSKRPSKPSHGVAIVGRPNVGKSSLFNRLAGKTRAIVSQKAHTTRDTNLAEAKWGDHIYRLYDTAGIRRAGKRRQVEAFSFMRTLKAINQAEVAVVVIDANEPSVKTDQSIAGLAKEASKGLVLAINKWDLIDDKADHRTLIEHKLRSDFAFAWWAPVIFISAQKGTNVGKLSELVQMIIANRSHSYEPSQLQNILNEAQLHHPPPKNRQGRPVFKSIAQTGTNPPEFTITGKYLDHLHWSYRRYLEAQLREHLNLDGTAIKIKFK